MGEPALRLPGSTAGPSPAGLVDAELERAKAGLTAALDVALDELERLKAEQARCKQAKERWLGLAELRQCVGTIRQASDGLAALRPRKPRG